MTGAGTAGPGRLTWTPCPGSSPSRRSARSSCGTAAAWTGWTPTSWRAPTCRGRWTTTGVFVGDAGEFCERVLASHRRYDASMHCVLNHLVDLDGPDDARGEAYVLAHVLRKDDEGTPVHDAWWGRYADRYERRDGRWGIAHRVTVHEWTRREPLGRPMRADTGLFRQGSEDRGIGAVLGPGAFPPRPAAGMGGSGAPASAS